MLTHADVWYFEPAGRRLPLSEHVFLYVLKQVVTKEVLRARSVSVEAPAEGGQGGQGGQETQGGAAKRERGAGSRHVCSRMLTYAHVC
jgi:hypothetical protein